jgi:RNA polymerase sigma-70 factor (ECF subfamily)
MHKVNLLLGTDSDEDLVGRVRQGDRDAERVLILRLYPGVYTLALRMTHNPERARDATQETFLRAFSRMHQYDGIHRFSAWVFKILINFIRDGARRGNRVVTMELKPDDWPSDQPIPLDVAIREESSERVRREVEKLPEAMRVAILLHFQEGFNGREVGYALGISHAAARLKISRAMAKLRQRMGSGE